MKVTVSVASPSIFQVPIMFSSTVTAGSVTHGCSSSYSGASSSLLQLKANSDTIKKNGSNFNTFFIIIVFKFNE